MKKWFKKYCKQCIAIAICISPLVVAFCVSSYRIPWPKIEGNNDWIGFWGSYLGAIIGAVVAAWGIIITIKENRKLGVAPYLIFEEVDEIPEKTMVYGHFIDISGNSYAEKIVRITNVGNGVAIEIKIETDGKCYIQIPVLEKERTVYVAFEYGIELPEENIDKLSKEEIEQYCSQSRKTNVRVSCADIFGNKSFYELGLKIECIINGMENKKRTCSKNLYLTGWKMK